MPKNSYSTKTAKHGPRLGMHPATTTVMRKHMNAVPTVSKKVGKTK